MLWNLKQKQMSINLPTTPHQSSNPSVIARPPSTSKITFTPTDFFGAAARCLHLHVINPALASPEAKIISALVAQHVDDTSLDFAILSTADNFKDYAKSYFSGTVAQGLAYLLMINDGYVWTDHFENEKKKGPGKGNTKATRSPDFVFARPGYGDVALMESKGTRSATTLNGFDPTVDDGYKGQVEPHLGYMIGSSTATHGFCVGAWLTSPTKAEFKVHHTDAVSAVPSPGTGVGGTASVQQGNYATVFQLAHSVGLADQVRVGRTDDRIPFYQFSWLGREWLTHRLELTGFRMPVGPPWVQLVEPVWPYYSLPDFYFALEKNICEQILNGLARETIPEYGFELNLIPKELIAAAHESRSSIFPDGFAIANAQYISPLQYVEWSRKDRAIVIQ